VAFASLTASTIRSGVLVAALIGFACDLGQSTPFGVSAAAFAFTAFCVSELQRRFRIDSLPARACVIGLATVNITFLQSIVVKLSGQTLLPWMTLANRSLLTGIYTAGMAVPVLMILGWVAERNSQTVLLRE
jgi:rod shape-determining protein MreD